MFGSRPQAPLAVRPLIRLLMIKIRYCPGGYRCLKLDDNGCVEVVILWQLVSEPAAV